MSFSKSIPILIAALMLCGVGCSKPAGDSGQSDKEQVSKNKKAPKLNRAAISPNRKLQAAKNKNTVAAVGKHGESKDTKSLEERFPDGKIPQVQVDEPIYDFKSVAQGESIKHVFTIRNTGKGVLKIENARGS